MKRLLIAVLASLALAPAFAAVPVTTVPLAKDAAGNYILSTPVISLNEDGTINSGSGGGAGGTVDIDQTTPGTTNGVVVNSSALPTGAATAAKQPALGTAGSASTDVLSVQGIASGTPLIIGGAVAAGASDSGNPAKVGCVYNSTKPTYTTGQRTDCQSGTRGAVVTQISGADGTTAVSANSSQVDGLSNSLGTLNASALTYGFNGTTWDRLRGDTTGSYAVPTPTSSANNTVSITTSSTAEEGSRVVCAAACNAYGFQVNTGATSGWVMSFNATSAPADGAVTPDKWWQVAANSTLTVDLAYGGIPLRRSTGWTLVFSSTGPFTKTISATATFSAESK